MALICAYKGCFNRYSPCSFLSFFSFPYDNRGYVWVKHSGNSEMENFYMKTQAKLCESHFEDSDIKILGTKKALRKGTIPKSYDKNICSCVFQIMDKNCGKLLNLQSQIVRPPYGINKSINFSDNLDNILETSTNCNIENESPFLNDNNLSLEGNFPPPDRNLRVYSNPLRNISFPSFENCQINAEPDIKKLKPNEEPSTSKIPRYIFRSPKKNTKVKPKIQLENIVKEKINNLFSKKTDAVRTFILTQLSHNNNSQWKEYERDIYLKFYYKSPSFYRFLLEFGFSLPPVTTIQRWHTEIKFFPGLIQPVLDLLKQKYDFISSTDKKCVLLLDEMAIKPELEYSSREDVIYGFVDHGHLGRKNIIATHALIVMLRGLNSNWKQVIGVYIGNVNELELSKIIK